MIQGAVLSFIDACAARILWHYGSLSKQNYVQIASYAGVKYVSESANNAKINKCLK